MRGVWVYLYRGGQAGLTVDFYLSRKRDMEAAKQFLRKAMKHQRVPIKITLDAYPVKSENAANYWLASGFGVF